MNESGGFATTDQVTESNDPSSTSAFRFRDIRPRVVMRAIALFRRHLTGIKSACTVWRLTSQNSGPQTSNIRQRIYDYALASQHLSRLYLELFETVKNTFTDVRMRPNLSSEIFPGFFFLHALELFKSESCSPCANWNRPAPEDRHGWSSNLVSWAREWEDERLMIQGRSFHTQPMIV